MILLLRMAKLIKKIDEIFKRKYNKYKHLLNDKYKYFFDKNNNNIIYFKHKKNIIKTEFQFLGIFKKNSNLFIWADVIPGVNQKLITQVELIKNSSFMFESLDNKIIQFYFQLLNKDSVFINDDKYIDLIIKLVLYLTNGLFVITPVSNKNYIQFILITKIISQ